MVDYRGLLQDAVNEVTMLRRANEIMTAKLDMIELMRDMLGAKPERKSLAMAPDIVWQMQMAIDEITAAFDDGKRGEPGSSGSSPNVNVGGAGGTSIRDRVD